MNTLKLGYLHARQDGDVVVIGTEFPEEPLNRDQTVALYEFLGDILEKPARVFALDDIKGL